MNIKKLIATVVFALGAWMSVGVMAQTNYNFSETWNNFNIGGSYYTETVTGTFTTDSTVISGDNSYVITGWSNVRLSGAVTGNASYIEAPGSNSFYYGRYNPSNNQFSDNFGGGYGSAYVVFGGSGFTNISGTAYWRMNLKTLSTYYDPNTIDLLAICPGSSCLASSTIVATNGPEQHYVSVSAAPEMNASFIPQVALMLACLFFLFGRKKENTELMLAA